MLYRDMKENQLLDEKSKQLKKYEELKSIGFDLNMARGKPEPAQLKLSEDMLLTPSLSDLSRTKDGVDTRNYGLLTGIIEAKQLFAEILSVDPIMVMVGGNSSLSLMFDCISFSYQFGIFGGQPWNKLEKVKFLCPSPGYDRHFGICELFGIEMINIDMNEDGPDMERVKQLVESDDAVKGIWCVPKYSNPTGVTYKDEIVDKFAALNPAAKDFRIYWDNAYIIHHIKDTQDNLKNIFDACKKFGSEDLVLEFSSTSKITFPGAGLAAIASSPSNLEALKKIFFYKTIGPDKINQLRHSLFFNSNKKLDQHMQKHASILKPKFEIVINYLDNEIKPYGIGTYTNPNGGYFISFNSLKGCASRIGDLCKEAGLILTDVGATYPYSKDPENKNIRIAPTFPPLNELKDAMAIFCTSVKIASLEKLLKEV